MKRVREAAGVHGDAYELVEEIASAPSGKTYKARQRVSGSLAAVTVLSPSLLADRGRLGAIRSAVEHASRLRHPRIVPVLEFRRELDRYLVVEAFSDAEPLERVLRESGAFAMLDALRFARELADALAHAHENGIVHGRLGPEHVRLERDALRPVVSGFGIPFAASIRYSAPEQVAGGEVDARTDIFAFGLLLFELLEGRPFFAGDEEETKAILLRGDTPLLPRFSRIAPVGVPRLVARTLRRRPAARPTMARVRAEIDACLSALGGAAPAPRARAPRDVPVRRHTLVVVDEAVGEEKSERPRASGITAERVVAERLLIAAGGRPRRSRRGPYAALAGAVIVGVLLGWRLLGPRRVERPPAPPVAVAPPEVAPPEPPPAEPVQTVDVPPSPPPDEVVDEGPPAPPEEPAAPAASVDVARPPPPEEPTPAVEAPVATTDAGTMGPVAPPRIESYRPRDRDPLTLSEGAATIFSARAVSDEAQGTLAYAWFVDGKRAARGPSWRFVAPPAATASTHTVELRVSDDAGRTAVPVSWNVAVTPQISADNVRDWLERVVAAWQARDLATLRLYGIVGTADEERAVREQMPRQGHWVAIANEAIRTDGRFATVRFDLVEHDERGRSLSSSSESYALEKRADGFVALRPR
jgi:Protein kinase domain